MGVCADACKPIVHPPLSPPPLIPPGHVMIGCTDQRCAPTHCPNLSWWCSFLSSPQLSLLSLDTSLHPQTQTHLNTRRHTHRKSALVLISPLPFAPVHPTHSALLGVCVCGRPSSPPHQPSAARERESESEKETQRPWLAECSDIPARRSAPTTPRAASVPRVRPTLHRRRCTFVHRSQVLLSHHIIGISNSVLRPCRCDTRRASPTTRPCPAAAAAPAARTARACPRAPVTCLLPQLRPVHQQQ
jgi:hypothetical protein